MNDENPKEPYLLDDEDFCRVMEQKYQASGQTPDELAAGRIWQKIKQKQGHQAKRSRGLWFGLLGLAAAVILFLKLPNEISQPNQSQFKSGTEKSDLELFTQDAQGQTAKVFKAGQAISLFVHSASSSKILIYGGLVEQKLRLLQTLEPQSQSTNQTVELSAKLTEGLSKICVLAVEPSDDIKALEQTLSSLWDQINPKHCVSDSP